MRPDKPVLRAGEGERADSPEPAPRGRQVLSLLCSPGGPRQGPGAGMAASHLVQELHSIGDRLLLKLQRLPRAEPVEILAFSVLVVFTGKPGLPDGASSAPRAPPRVWERTPWCQ